MKMEVSDNYNNISGMTAKQLIALYTDWTDEIDKKITSLTRGSRAYTILNYFGAVNIAMLTVCLLTLDSALVYNNFNSLTRLILGIIIFIFQLILAFFNTSMGIIQPSTKANNCSMCSKQYSELYREMDVMINKLSNNINSDEIVEEYSTNALYYSEREQIILLAEPQLVFIGHKKGSLLFPKNDDIKRKVRVSRNSRNTELQQLVSGDLPV